MKRLLKYTALAVLVAGLAVFALIGWQSVTRGTPVGAIRSAGDIGAPAVTDSLFARTMEMFSGIHLDPGNRVEVLENGNGTYPRLWRDLASAQRTVTVQMYYSQPGEIADSLAKYLIDRAQHKVRVLLLFDAFGSGPLLKDKDYVKRLQDGGVQVARLRRLHWYSLNKANFRSHVRVVTVDGRIGYTGGFGLADYWEGDGRHKEQWRETNARFEGPIVMQLQAVFAAAWAEATHELLVGDAFFPRDGFLPRGPTEAGILFAMPTTGSTPAERFMALSIASARKTLYITNSYFVPDDDFRRFLIDAVHRGVDVRVLTAGDMTDVKTTTYAGRARYEELMKEGVRIYEYGPTMMHAKTMVVDGLWGTVGSLNFDNRSLAFNNESNLVTLDSTVGAAMDSMFLADLRYSKEIEPAKFARRPWTEKALEMGANVLSRLL
ncbi:MAG TPA: phospholipase D-like domain-containing protein [Gemmatimonadaceae bacterium]|nr:phospholipase D-like domain-containing protein [Gemmatimonadaceae bacterium]